MHGTNFGGGAKIAQFRVGEKALFRTSRDVDECDSTAAYAAAADRTDIRSKAAIAASAITVAAPAPVAASAASVANPVAAPAVTASSIAVAAPVAAPAVAAFATVCTSFATGALFPALPAHHFGERGKH